MIDKHDSMADDFNHLLKEAERVLGSGKWIVKLVEKLGKRCQELEEENMRLEIERNDFRMQRDSLHDELERLQDE